eukprot:TRINITY_DN5520_c0_g2_i1.p1 TRINITY_DN5520_c0_g2~~TRINITY_DN5520_c0_g2_i1.p1  ORF type:complete len:1028 (+),score=230.10 TRINITY_DN5520_c0_g2_i1:400-3084(+)
MEKYTSYASHELHLFLYKHDRSFFSSHITPYLKNKTEKTFLDKWFLGESLQQYWDPKEFRKLNPLEIVLLADSVPTHQQSVVAYINDVLETRPVNTADTNRLFDIALRESELSGPLKEETPAIPAATTATTTSSLSTSSSYNRADRKLCKQSLFDDDEDDSFGYAGNKYMAARNNATNRQTFQHTDPSQKLVESNYYKKEGLVQFNLNLFWLDYARRNRSKSFISNNIIFATSSLTELLVGLALLDLPLRESTNEIVHTNDTTSIKANSPLLVFQKVLKQSQVESGGILVSQTFLDPFDRYQVNKGERIEKIVQDEFLIQKIYAAKLVVTNVSSNKKRCSLLTQIPVGAIPVSNGNVTKSHYFDLEPYQTTTPPIEYFFYFPMVGHFNHFPAHVVQDEVVIAFAPATTFNVVETRTKHDKTSWEFLSQMAGEEELLRFLKNENLYAVGMDKILWRLANSRDFFLKVIDILGSRLYYDEKIWSYSVYHKDVRSAKQFLKENSFVGSDKVGPFLTSELVTTTSTLPHLEYDNILNRRAHQLGGKKHIADVSLRQQYQSFLENLCFKPSLCKSDLLAAIYYLLLQDRIEEALTLFNRVEVVKKETTDTQELRLQLDYLRCYLDFFSEDPKVARTIAPKYTDYPILRWRKMFEEVQRQLKLIDEGTFKQGGQSASASQQTEEPALDFEVEGSVLRINYNNLSECLVYYYKMDVELLFSSSPFVQQNSGHFSFIQPNIKQTVKLPSNQHSLDVSLPSECENVNVMIEVRSEGGIRKSKPHFSHSLFVQLMENTGTLRVCSKSTGRPLPRSYVKVYAQFKQQTPFGYNNLLPDGGVAFYKDGYSDLTGLFPYAQMNKDLLAQVQTFSILVISEKNGSTILEAQPPSGSGGGQQTATTGVF